MLQENINTIKTVIELLTDELDKTTNNASMGRCRKRTLELTKLFKDYRKLSVAESKKK